MVAWSGRAGPRWLGSASAWRATPSAPTALPTHAPPREPAPQGEETFIESRRTDRAARCIAQDRAASRLKRCQVSGFLPRGLACGDISQEQLQGFLFFGEERASGSMGRCGQMRRQLRLVGRGFRGKMSMDPKCENESADDSRLRPERSCHVSFPIQRPSLPLLCYLSSRAHPFAQVPSS